MDVVVESALRSYGLRTDDKTVVVAGFTFTLHNHTAWTYNECWDLEKHGELYLFVRLSPFDDLHFPVLPRKRRAYYWSLDSSGRVALTEEQCQRMGLPELDCNIVPIVSELDRDAINALKQLCAAGLINSSPARERISELELTYGELVHGLDLYSGRITVTENFFDLYDTESNYPRTDPKVCNEDTGCVPIPHPPDVGMTLA
ncbi:hypothetical protein V5O48_009999, partial [Marasmius crinis-equi]